MPWWKWNISNTFSSRSLMNWSQFLLNIDFFILHFRRSSFNLWWILLLLFLYYCRLSWLVIFFLYWYLFTLLKFFFLIFSWIFLALLRFLFLLILRLLRIDRVNQRILWILLTHIRLFLRLCIILWFSQLLRISQIKRIFSHLLYRSVILIRKIRSLIGRQVSISMTLFRISMHVPLLPYNLLSLIRIKTRRIKQVIRFVKIFWWQFMRIFTLWNLD